MMADRFDDRFRMVLSIAEALREEFGVGSTPTPAGKGPRRGW